MISKAPFVSDIIGFYSFPSCRESFYFILLPKKGPECTEGYDNMYRIQKLQLTKRRAELKRQHKIDQMLKQNILLFFALLVGF